MSCSPLLPSHSPTTAEPLPQAAAVVMRRITGWGSRGSRAATGRISFNSAVLVMGLMLPRAGSQQVYEACESAVSRRPYGGGVTTPAERFAALDVARAPRMLVAVGGTLEPDALVAAYRAGCFPWPSGEGVVDRTARRLARRGEVPFWAGEDEEIPWCSPDPRAVLLADRVVVSRSLRQTLRRSGWTTTMNTVFEDVMVGCATPAPGREDTWITRRMRAAYTALHRAGGAHSLEVWDGDELVGGLYGVLTGRVFSGESMFHRVADASKVALVDLCARLITAGIVLVDTQQATEHMQAMGQVLVARAEYLAVLASLRDGAVVLPRERLPVSRLVDGG